jgi:hypothetical protein
MTIDGIITDVFLKQGVLGALVVVGIIMFRNIFKELIRIIRNNTEAMTKNAEALKEVKAVIAKCDGPKTYVAR